MKKSYPFINRDFRILVITLVSLGLASTILLGCRKTSTAPKTTRSKSANGHREEMERVLKEDQLAALNPSSVAKVVLKMRAIETSACPQDFRLAYLKHIHAWESLAAVEEEAKRFNQNYNSSGAMVESFIRGLYFDVFGKTQEAIAAHKQLQQNYSKAIDEVRFTYHEVEKIAVGYGAELPPALTIEWSGSCTQPGKGEYPMKMTMNVSPNGEISGTIHWPELNNSFTRFTGKISKRKVAFTENELLSGSGIGIPCNYSAIVDDGVMNGTATFQGQTARFSVKATAGNTEILKGL